ncbi:DUF3501 family protein [Ferrimonas sediminicola]|uniref:DUF3501 family protein n=1 Tax=Ferrimonas sediminicola TaxID=2569538 RepID=A0A4U1BGS0_9GAMM|nr:DUF3501 family protein [Ferrimonas sediminicola]TKB49912.1 DUF3501 family protein [Ferrimonas sediminicola]
MSKLTRRQLWSLEEYAEQRDAFRHQVMQHKRLRQLTLGDHVRLLFEDEVTIRYQVQEMLRIERIFEGPAIQEELDAYNPLIPDGTNLKATMMLEYPDVAERHRRLAQLAGIEHRVWLQVGEEWCCYAIADEDLERSDQHKTSSVHFLRFELAPEAILELKQGAPMMIGIDHPKMDTGPLAVPGPIREALAEDLAIPYAS